MTEVKKNEFFLSIIIPCFNEEKTITKVIKKIYNQRLKFKFEIIVVDDASEDNSIMLVNKLKKKETRIISLPENQGKGNAIKTGVSNCKGKYVLIQDADLEYNPDDYEKLLEPVFDFNADVVYGSRFVGSQAKKSGYFLNALANKGLTFLSNLFNNLTITDMETGYKLIKKSLYDKIDLEEKRFGLEPEITAKISKLTKSIYEVGISYNARTWEEGKKIGFKDGLRAIYCIIKYNFFR